MPQCGRVATEEIRKVRLRCIDLFKFDALKIFSMVVTHNVLQFGRTVCRVPIECYRKAF